MMKNLLSIFCLTMLFVFSFQEATSQQALSIPVEYQLPEDSKTGIRLSGNVQRGKIWEVFSDRNNNKSYNSIDGTVKKDKIGFLEAFYVIQQQGNWLRVVKDPGMGYDGELTSQAVEYGWMKKENLLLWNHSLVDPEYKIDRKAMIINTVEYAKSGFQMDKGDLVSMYNDPSLQTNYKTNYNSKLYRIYYIYKRQGNAVLLGRTSRIPNPDKVGNAIVGWVNKGRIISWDYRVAAEPNWEPAAVKERAGKPIQFYVDVPTAQLVKQGQNPPRNKILMDVGTYEDRRLGEWRRYPIVEYIESENIIVAGVMGQVEGDGGSSMTSMSTEKYAEIEKRYNDLRRESRNINIVFVVDGTKSVTPFFPTVSEAINNSIRNIQRKYEKNNVRFGAVVFRDFAEGDRLEEVLPLTSGSKVASFIKGVEPGDSRDTDLPEAVNYGLKRALRSVGFRDNQTNIVILVGDCGNHNRRDESQVPASDIIRRMVDKGTHFMAIQVAHKTQSTYDDFVEQSKNIALSAAKQKLCGHQRENTRYAKPPVQS
jgi:hypothetical protein